MAASPTPDPEFADFVPKPSPGRGFSPVRILLILGIIAAVIAMFLPAPRTARRASRRLRCASNLRQIAIAIQGYEHTYQALPPAYTLDAAGRPLHSWRTLILPYTVPRNFMR